MKTNNKTTSDNYVFYLLEKPYNNDDFCVEIHSLEELFQQIINYIHQQPEENHLHLEMCKRKNTDELIAGITIGIRSGQIHSIVYGLNTLTKIFKK